MPTSMNVHRPEVLGHRVGHSIRVATPQTEWKPFRADFQFNQNVGGGLPDTGGILNEWAADTFTPADPDFSTFRFQIEPCQGILIRFVAWNTADSNDDTANYLVFNHVQESVTKDNKLVTSRYPVCTGVLTCGNSAVGTLGAMRYYHPDSAVTTAGATKVKFADTITVTTDYIPSPGSRVFTPPADSVNHLMFDTFGACGVEIAIDGVDAGTYWFGAYKCL